jgi:hypothetical protein
MSTSSPAKTISGAARRRAALILSGAAVAIVACGAMASSALALSWWVETPPAEELALGKKLYLGSAAKVNTPFTLKWRKKFEISCGGEVTYNNLYIEGHLGIGAEGGINFGKCVAKKPKGTVLIGEKVKTLPLAGTITPSGSKYLFSLAPETAVVASFQLERTVKPRKHYKAAKNKLCKYNVEAVGKLEGELGGKPAEISTEKTLDFASHELTMKSTKECESVMAAVPAARKPQAASGLTLRTKGQGPLPAGAALEAISHDALLETANGNLECEENVFAGPLTSNNGTTDGWQIAAAIAQGNFEKIPGACKTSAEGPAQVQWSGFPWIAGLSSKGTISIKSKQGIEVTASFLAAEGASCAFVAPQLAGVSNVTGPVTITFTKQPFKLVKGSAGVCPASGTLSGHFTLTSSGEPVEAEAAVSEKEKHEESEEVVEEEAEEAEEEAGLPLEGNKGKLGYSGTSGWGFEA